MPDRRKRWSWRWWQSQWWSVKNLFIWKLLVFCFLLFLLVVFFLSRSCNCFLTRNWSHRYSSCRRRCCWGVSFKKLKGSIVSNRIAVKFGRNVLRLTESDSRFDVTLSRWPPWRHFTQESVTICIWWVNTKHLPAACLCSSVRAYVLVWYLSFWHSLFKCLSY